VQEVGGADDSQIRRQGKEIAIVGIGFGSELSGNPGCFVSVSIDDAQNCDILIETRKSRGMPFSNDTGPEDTNREIWV
jgi:hypothetical protein